MVSGMVSGMVRDPGGVDFNVDLGRGVVIVTVRPPLALPSGAVSAELPILDVLDLFADMVKGLNQAQRDAIAQLRNGALLAAKAQ